MLTNSNKESAISKQICRIVISLNSTFHWEKRMINRFTLCSIICFGLIVSTVSGSGRGAFSTVGGGARDRIFGSSFVAVADDASAIKWNPAGIAFLAQRQASASHASLFSLGDSSYDYSDTSSSLNEDIVNVANIFPGYGLPLGISYHRIGTNGMIISDERGTILDLNGSYAEQLFTLSTGKMFDVGKNKVALGINLNRYSISSSSNRNGLGIDTGILFSPDNRLLPQLGLSLNGLTGKFDLVDGEGESDSLPSILNYGLAYRLLQDQLTISAGLAKASTDQQWKYGVAGEYSIYRLFPIHLSLRGGYHFRGSRSENDLSVDVGNANLGFSMNFSRFKFDYSFEPHTILGSTHRITLTMLQFSPTELYWQKGKQHFSRLDEESALNSFHKLTRLNPRSARARHQIARIYERQGKLDQAIELLHKIKELDENYFYKKELQILLEDLDGQR